MWVILYLSRERQHFKNTLVYIRRNKAKNVGRKKFFGFFFRNILLIFLIDFWLSLIEILRMQLDFFVWFLELFSILLFFYREKKIWWRGSQFLLFLYTCRFFLLSPNYTRRIKNSASSSNYPSGRKRFRRSKRCKGKSPLHDVPGKAIPLWLRLAELRCWRRRIKHLLVSNWFFFE